MLAQRLFLMPVDRELAYESLKWEDPQVYRAYLRIKYREITKEEFEKDRDTFYRVYLTEQLFDSLDSAEQTGMVEIYNDHKNERILVKVNHYNSKRDKSDFIV
jgi:hypothetical protein